MPITQMPQESLLFTLFLIFSGAAIGATLAIYFRQSLLVAYVLLGLLLGPSVTGLVDDTSLLESIAHTGIIFLLFLLGLNLNPRELILMMRKTIWVTLISSLVFGLAGVAITFMFGFSLSDTLLVGAVTTFSSTIIALKLLPTTVLHHQRTGEFIISILLLQDLLAIGLLVSVQLLGGGETSFWKLLHLLLALPLLVLVGWLITTYVLIPLMCRYDKIKEYIFLVSIGWCLGMAELAKLLGLSAEIGAFIAGIMLATCPISLFIAENLKPLRDFFLVLFFFVLGARIDLSMMVPVIVPALILALVVLVLKPVIFAWLIGRLGESVKRSREIGLRLGQLSEFSLLVSVVAVETGILSEKAGYLIQFATLVTFIASSYWIVFKLPTPIAYRDDLRLD